MCLLCRNFLQVYTFLKEEDLCFHLGSLASFSKDAYYVASEHHVATYRFLLFITVHQLGKDCGHFISI